MKELGPDEIRRGSPEESAPKGPAPTPPDDERDEDDTFWDKVRRGVVEGYQIAAEKTDVYARIASRRLSIVGIMRRIERYRGDIGERVYDMLGENPAANIAEDSRVKELIERIRAAEDDLGRKEAEIEEIRRESGARPVKGSEDSR
jgi:hypothetical protein